MRWDRVLHSVYHHATLLGTDRTRRKQIYLIEPVTPEIAGEWSVVMIDAGAQAKLRAALHNSVLDLSAFGMVIIEGSGIVPEHLINVINTQLETLPPPDNYPRYL